MPIRGTKGLGEDHREESREKKGAVLNQAATQKGGRFPTSTDLDTNLHRLRTVGGTARSEGETVKKNIERKQKREGGK